MSEFVLPSAEETPNQTREAIAKMSGFENFEQVGKETPEQTSLPGMQTTEDAPKKRGRKPGSKNSPKTANVEADPLAGDKRYQQAVERMAAFGSTQAIETAFKVTGAPLETEEKQRVEDLAYVASKKFSLDPSKSPMLMAIYTVILLVQLILVRIAGTTSGEMWKQFSGLFGKKDEEEIAE